MQSLTTLFQKSCLSLAVVSSVMFGAAEGAAFPQFLTIPLAFLAFHLTEKSQRFSLRLWQANLLGLCAFAAAVIEFGSDNLEARLLSGGHLLVYLSWITLFMSKRPRQYWWLCGLGVLQVAVGSVLTRDAWYGLMLLAYLALIIWTLTIFSMYQAQLSIRRNGLRRGHAESDRPTAAGSVLGVGGRRIAVALVPNQSAAIGTIQIDSGETWINSRFLISVFGTIAGSMLICCLVFTTVPRVWVGRTPFSNQPLIAEQAMTGFTDTVRLGDMGEILESNERVLGVRAYDNETNEPLDFEQYAEQLGYTEPLFRGAVMSRYKGGRWIALRPGQGDYVPFPRLHQVNTEGVVRQEMVIQQAGTPYIFLMLPFVTGKVENTKADLRMDRLSSIVRARGRDARVQSLQLTLLSRRSRDARSFNPWRGYPRESRLHTARQWYTHYPRTLARLRKLAVDVAGDQGRDSNPAEALRAERIVSYLRDSGEYRYSIQSDIVDPTIDPVEDFLFNRKTGYCEHFASALTLMLRATGVPARLVSGFKGGVVNELTGSFEVQQRHAHAWAEAYIDDEWVTLDATPAAARSESVKSVVSSFDFFNDLRMALDELWSGLVLNVSFAQQRQNLYQPLQDSATALQTVFMGDPDSQRQAGGSTGRALRSLLRITVWIGIAVTLFVMIFGGMIARAKPTSLLGRLFSAFGVSRSARADRVPVPTVDFYESFQRICQRHGLERRPHQTQREFAQFLCGEFRDGLALDDLSSLPLDLVNLFYRERFELVPVDPSTRSRICAQLDRLDECLRRNGARSRRNTNDR